MAPAALIHRICFLDVFPNHASVASSQVRIALLINLTSGDTSGWQVVGQPESSASMMHMESLTEKGSPPTRLSSLPVMLLCRSSS